MTNEDRVMTQTTTVTDDIYILGENAVCYLPRVVSSSQGPVTEEWDCDTNKANGLTFPYSDRSEAVFFLHLIAGKQY